MYIRRGETEIIDTSTGKTVGYVGNDGINRLFQYASQEEFRIYLAGDTGTLAQACANIGSGPVWIAGQQYYCDGVGLTPVGGVPLIPDNSSYATAAVNSAAIQGALNNGNLTLTRPGTFYFNGTWTIPSDCKISVSPGVNLIRVGISTLNNAVRVANNANYDSTVFPVIGQISTSVHPSSTFLYYCTVTVTAHDVTAAGQYILLKNDINKLVNGVHKVTSFTATSVTFLMPYKTGTAPVSATSASQPLTIALADANITIDWQGTLSGGIENNVTNTNDNLNSMGFIFNKVGNLKINRIAEIGGFKKYSIHAANLWKFKFNDINFKNTSDGIHLNNPVNNGVIDGITGITSDSFIGLTVIDYTRFTLNDDKTGDSENIIIKNAMPTHCANILISGGGINNVNNIVFDNLHLDSSNNYGVLLGGLQSISFTANTTTGSPTLSNVVNSNIYYTSLVGYPVTGPGIPSGAYVLAHDTVAATITLTVNATATASAVALTTPANDTIDSVTFTNCSPPDNASLVTIQTCSVTNLDIQLPKNKLIQKRTDLQITAATTSGNKTIPITDTTGIQKGALVSGSGIPSGAYVVTVNANVSIVISIAPTSTVANNALKITIPQGIKKSLVNHSVGGKSERISISGGRIFIDCTNSSYDRALITKAGAGTSIGMIEVTNVVQHGIGAALSHAFYVGADVSGIKTTGCSIINYGRVYEGNSITGPAAKIEIKDISLHDAQGLLGTIATNSTVTIDGINIYGSIYTYPLNFYTTGATYNLNIRGVYSENATTFCTAVAGVTLNVKNCDASWTLDGTKYTFTKGCLFNNTNVAYGAGVGVYIAGTASTLLLVA